MAGTGTSTGWSDFLGHYLTSTNPGLLTGSLQAAFERKVCDVAVAAVDRDSCLIDDDWAAVEDLLACPGVEDELLVDELMRHAASLRKTLLKANAGRHSAKSLGEKLQSAMPAVTSQTPAPQVSFPLLWHRIAGEIAATALEDFAVNRYHWRTYALLAFAGHVQMLTSSNVGATARALNHLTRRSLLGMRGAVTRLPHALQGRRILDPLSASMSASWHQGPTHTRFLLEVDNAISRIQRRGGFISGFLNANNPVAPRQRSAASKISPALIAAIRRAIYLQYDALVLGVLAYSGLEQVLRARMQKLGMAHYNKAGRPYPVLNWLKKLRLPTQLEAMITEVYDGSQANTRNRLWHSSFLLVDHCRPEITHALTTHGKYAPGPHYPESMARQATRLLAGVTQHWTRSDLDFSWATTTPLSKSQELVLGSFKWELDGTGILKDQAQFRLYVDNVAPSLSTLFKRGVLSTISNPPIEQLAALVLVFEGLLRHTCDLLNFSTVDFSVRASGGTTNVQMLDDAGLLRAEVINALLEPLPTAQHTHARDFLAVVIDFRNLFAHGAIRAVSAAQRELVGRVVVKLAYWLGAVGIRHIIQERAYFLHRDDDQGGYVDNWLAAEKDVFGWLGTRLNQLNSLQTPAPIQRLP